MVSKFSVVRTKVYIYMLKYICILKLHSSPDLTAY